MLQSTLKDRNVTVQGCLTHGMPLFLWQNSLSKCDSGTSDPAMSRFLQKSKNGLYESSLCPAQPRLRQFPFFFFLLRRRIRRRVFPLSEHVHKYHQAQDSIPSDRHLVPQSALSMRRTTRVRLPKMCSRHFFPHVAKDIFF